jgi:hypothetical protein
MIPILLGSLLIIGAGCASTAPEKSTDTTTGNTKDASTDVEVNGEKIEEAITLTGNITGAYAARLEWEPSADVAASAEKWMIVVGNEENPTYPENNRLWFQRDALYREKDWANLPAGTLHFRVCAWTGSACGEYSNNLTLEIPGRVPGTK